MPRKLRRVDVSTACSLLALVVLAGYLAVHSIVWAVTKPPAPVVTRIAMTGESNVETCFDRPPVDGEVIPYSMTLDLKDGKRLECRDYFQPNRHATTQSPCMVISPVVHCLGGRDVWRDNFQVAQTVTRGSIAELRLALDDAEPIAVRDL